ncbi:tetratricopeptide repeat protein [Nonlabens ponticola]|nr:tetratricopeptide repeat protein [Nonlabens ponticola]
MKNIVALVLVLMCSAFAKAQLSEVQQQDYETAMANGQSAAQSSDFVEAEAAYRKAKAINPSSAEASYNLGNVYYNNKKGYSAVENYRDAALSAKTKEEKHKIFHNLGNTFMENKQYVEAVEAYKNALRNDPTDDETRYNLALAKQEEENQGGGGGNDKDQPEQGDNKDENQNKEGDQDENSDGKGDGDKEKDGDDKEGDDGKEKENDKGENSEGDNGDGKPKEQGGNEQRPRQEGQMTPQQIRQILEAMNNEEQKIQDKINARKQKGKGVRTEKDW